MSLKGGGRTKLNIKVHTELCNKEADSYFIWKRKWAWLPPEYISLQKELAAYSDTPSAARRKLDTRTLSPFPKTTNQMYGWLSAKEEFKLDRYGRDDWSIPLSPPED